MLYLRNTNQAQSLGKDIKRGITNLCCSPTLESVTSASFTQLNVDVLFGAYLVNCKSCVGGYIQVSEDGGSTWNTINPGNCSPSNLVPMPSQSAYYRAFTSCSAVDQPFDPLTSSFSNQIFYVPNSRLNYTFNENGAEGEFKIYVTGSTIISTTISESGNLYEIPSSSIVTASVATTSVPLTGSTSMSLLITGSNVSYYTSSCVFNSGSIFIGNYTAIPHQDYTITASISHQPAYPVNCGTNILTYTVESCDISNKIWYPANSNGLFTSASTSFGIITGSVSKSNIATGDCRYNTIYFSGSATFPLSGVQVYLGIVSGSFTMSGNAGGSFPWSMNITSDNNSGSILIDFPGSEGEYSLTPTNIVDEIVGIKLDTFVSPFSDRPYFVYISGSQVAHNPPVAEDYPYSLGGTFTLSGEGYIRSFGLGDGTGGQQTQYDCYY
jgi:hypothetical protein